MKLKSLPLREVEKKLESSPDGLTQAEAQKRLTQYGPNEIEEKKSNELLKFLSFFGGPRRLCPVSNSIQTPLRAYISR